MVISDQNETWSECTRFGHSTPTTVFTPSDRFKHVCDVTEEAWGDGDIFWSVMDRQEHTFCWPIPAATVDWRLSSHEWQRNLICWRASSHFRTSLPDTVIWQIKWLKHQLPRWQIIMGYNSISAELLWQCWMLTWKGYVSTRSTLTRQCFSLITYTMASWNSFIMNQKYFFHFS